MLVSTHPGRRGSGLPLRLRLLIFCSLLAGPATGAARAALRRISVLGALYQLDGNPKWADGARATLLAVAAFPDWHPVHFLDTAEMAMAVALGYD